MTKLTSVVLTGQDAFQIAVDAVELTLKAADKIALNGYWWTDILQKLKGEPLNAIELAYFVRGWFEGGLTAVFDQHTMSDFSSGGLWLKNSIRGLIVPDSATIYNELDSIWQPPNDTIFGWVWNKRLRQTSPRARAVWAYRKRV